MNRFHRVTKPSGVFLEVSVFKFTAILVFNRNSVVQWKHNCVICYSYFIRLVTIFQLILQWLLL